MMNTGPVNTGHRSAGIGRLSRRAALLGAVASLGGCGALASLNQAATALDTFDLTPAPGSTAGGRLSRTLVVARPDAPAGIATNRILVKPGPRSITYLPGAQWSDEVPLLVQSLLIRSISGTGRIGYVGQSENGPVPDLALLVRIDAFEAVEDANRILTATVDVRLTLMRDAEQQVIASRSFAQSAPAAGDSAPEVVAAFQAVMDALLPEMANWVLRAA